MELTNPVIETILNRRSIRHFTDQPIPREMLEALAQAGTYAPSGKNVQSCHFTVVTNQEKIQTLKAQLGTAAQRENVFFFGFHNPQALILVSNDHNSTNSIQDASCAAENILLAATSFGLGSVWLNPLKVLSDEPSIRQLLNQFGVPETHHVWATIALGWPVKQPQALPRKPDTIHFVD